jgi:ubiquinone/menaquinone biosynthesis C-methylase UbiE
MDDQVSANAWLEEETARRYQIFTERTTMYQELSQVMVALAELKPGMQVLDLGCGTGVTTQAVLPVLGSNGHVYALDMSGPMLKLAREQLNPEQVTFVQADAAEVAHFVESHSIDRILCNSVFWQFRHKYKVLPALHQILAPEGRFVFNVPEPYFIFKDIPRSPKVSLLFKQLAAERYGVGQQDLRTIKLFLENHGFELIKIQEFTRVRSDEESYLFFQLPVATAWMEPPLDYQTRLALLEEARHMAQTNETVQQRWIYFVTHPMSSFNQPKQFLQAL